jgi:maltose O-acetyltransferase
MVWQYRVIDRHGGGGKLICKGRVMIDEGCDIDITSDVIIGENTILCEEVRIFTHDHNRDDPWDRSLCTTSPLIIGRNCWIGTRAMILNGCNFIADGVWIGAGAVVTKDITTPNATVVGNPARIVGGDE